MSWANLKKKYGRQWIDDVLDLIIRLEEEEIDPVKVLSEAVNE